MRGLVHPLVTDLVVLVLIEIRAGKNRFPSGCPVIDPRLVRIRPFRNEIGVPILPVQLEYCRDTESSPVGSAQFHSALPQLLERRRPRGNLRSHIGVPVDPPTETHPGP